MIAIAGPPPNVVAQRLTGRDYLSYSAVSTFMTCPLRYQFRYVQGLPESTVPASLAFGGAIHAAVQKHFEELLEGNPAPDLDLLLAAYRDAWKLHAGQIVLFGKHENCETLNDLADRMLATFRTSELANANGKILGIEEELRGELIPGCPDILARVDLIVDGGDGLTVTDFKTARGRWSSTQLQSSAGQLLLYHELVKPFADGRPIRLEFAVFTKGKTPSVERLPVPVDPVQLERTKRIVARVWSAIQAGHFYPNPSPRNCSGCPFWKPCRALDRVNSRDVCLRFLSNSALTRWEVPFMTDLKDGESVTMQGSGKLPYVLKNVGGVYSCSCPAWRNQSLGIERRTCKHLRILRGEAAEEVRLGALPAPASKGNREPILAPPLLLAETWDGVSDCAGWWLSEKLDGVRAWWDGSQFLSRLGNRYHAPDWFTAGLPEVPLDGELWLGRKMFQRTVSTVRRQDQSQHWREIRFRVFDAPAVPEPFERRMQALKGLLSESGPRYAEILEQVVCRGLAHVQEELARIEALGGEGLMLRQPGSRYEPCRSQTLLKVKSFHDAEARVIGHQLGTGRHRGRLGALLVEFAGGIHFAVGTGLSDRERDNPPPVGTTITFRYQELTDSGVPRFPVYVGIREEVPIPQINPKEKNMAQAGVLKRRFKFVGGGSDKFWEVGVADSEVTVRFGRNGTEGQANSKTFPDAGTAAKHVEKLIKEKAKKGYVEVQ